MIQTILEWMIGKDLAQALFFILIMAVIVLGTWYMNRIDEQEKEGK